MAKAPTVKPRRAPTSVHPGKRPNGVKVQHGARPKQWSDGDAPSPPIMAGRTTALEVQHSGATDQWSSADKPSPSIMAGHGAGIRRRMNGKNEKQARPRRMKSPANGDVVNVDTLLPDPLNRRVHTERNLTMIADALRAVGPARSIVVDEDNVVQAGNGVIAAAAAAGLSKVRIIDTDGETLIAVRRRGLTDDQKRALAMYDNRTAELAEWDAAQLAADLRDGSDLSAFFLPDELQKLFGDPLKHPVEFLAVDENTPTQHRCPKCGYEWSGQAAPGKPDAADAG
jgi:hypothetical protein